MVKPLVVENLKFRYPGGSWLLDDISFSVEAGEVVAVTGPSGCGKSTLCYCLCGVIPQIYEGDLSGQVLVAGLNMQQVKMNQLAGSLSMVFQEPANQLFAPSVEYELAFGMENLAWSRERMEKSLTNALEICGISELRHASPQQLSGGQQQLVALAAALATDPQILIFDEAMSQLDEYSTKRIKEIVQRISADGKAVFMVEHQQENLDIADRILCLKSGVLANL